MGGVFYVIIGLATIVLIVYFTEAHRRIPVQYAKSVFRGGRMYKQSGATHIPLRVNTAGMIPLIFAMSLILFPGIVASYFAGPASNPNFANTIMTWFSPNAPLPIGFFYWGLYFLLTIGFFLLYCDYIPATGFTQYFTETGGFIPVSVQGHRPRNIWIP
jgi:preprotein translocase subunit SecY